jgi:hypothetical protein
MLMSMMSAVTSKGNHPGHNVSFACMRTLYISASPTNEQDIKFQPPPSERICACSCLSQNPITCRTVLPAAPKHLLGERYLHVRHRHRQVLEIVGGVAHVTPIIDDEILVPTTHRHVQASQEPILQQIFRLPRLPKNNHINQIPASSFRTSSRRYPFRP